MLGTQLLRTDPEGDYATAIQHAVDVWSSGGIVAFPTETVYGVGVRADRPEAVERLRRLKSREDGKPFTVHIGRKTDVDRYVPELRGAGRRLAQRGWPGPLTLVFENVDLARAAAVREHGRAAASEMYNQGSIGLRCPDDHTAADLLSRAGGPVVAASANRAGAPPPSSAEQVLAQLHGEIDLVVDGGSARYAKASTVVRVTASGFEVLREGVYEERTLRRLAMLNVLLVCSGNTCRSPMAAAILKKLISERLGVPLDQLEQHGVTVCSAGTAGGSGAPASPHAVEVISRRGLELSDHRSQPLTEELIRSADAILVMTEAHRESVIGIVPSARERCMLLADSRDIDDPVGQSLEVYATCADSIEAALRDRLEEVLS